MGQAKRRGTLEQRETAAIRRNEAILAEVKNDVNPKVIKFIKKHGIQRFAQFLRRSGYETTHFQEGASPQPPKQEAQPEETGNVNKTQ